MGRPRVDLFALVLTVFCVKTQRNVFSRVLRDSISHFVGPSVRPSVTKSFLRFFIAFLMALNGREETWRCEKPFKKCF